MQDHFTVISKDVYEVLDCLAFVSTLDGRENAIEEDSQRTEETANSNGFAADNLKVMDRDSGSRNCFLELLNET